MATFAIFVPRVASAGLLSNHILRAGACTDERRLTPVLLVPHVTSVDA